MRRALRTRRVLALRQGRCARVVAVRREGGRWRHATILFAMGAVALTTMHIKVLRLRQLVRCAHVAAYTPSPRNYCCTRASRQAQRPHEACDCLERFASGATAEAATAASSLSSSLPGSTFAAAHSISFRLFAIRSLKKKPDLK